MYTRVHAQANRTIALREPARIIYERSCMVAVVCRRMFAVAVCDLTETIPMVANQERSIGLTHTLQKEPIAIY